MYIIGQKFINKLKPNDTYTILAIDSSILLERVSNEDPLNWDHYTFTANELQDKISSGEFKQVNKDFLFILP